MNLAELEKAREIWYSFLDEDFAIITRKGQEWSISMEDARTCCSYGNSSIIYTCFNDVLNRIVDFQMNEIKANLEELQKRGVKVTAEYTREVVYEAVLKNMEIRRK